MLWKTLRNLFYKTRTLDPVFSLAEFQKLVVSATNLHFPAVKLTTPQVDEIHYDDNGVQGTFHLRNSYRDYVARPERLDEMANRLVMALQDQRDPLRRHLMPVIKTAGFITRLKNSTDAVPYYEPFNDDLRIVYVEDSDAITKYIPRETIQEAGIELSEVRAIATANLARHMKDRLKVIRRKGIDQITTDGTYEPSLILLPEVFQDKRLRFRGDPVIAIPARGVLLVTGSKNTSRRIKLLLKAAEVAQTSQYPISPDLFQLSAGQWKSLGGLEYQTYLMVNGEVVQLD